MKKNEKNQKFLLNNFRFKNYYYIRIAKQSQSFFDILVMKMLFELLIRKMHIVCVVDTYASSFKDLNHIRICYSVPKWFFCRELYLLHDTQVVNDSRSFTNYIVKTIANDLDALERKYMSFQKELSLYENYPDEIPKLKNY